MGPYRCSIDWLVGGKFGSIYQYINEKASFHTLMMSLLVVQYKITFLKNHLRWTSKTMVAFAENPKPLSAEHV